MVIMLYVLLRFTDSDYPFGIFKCFLPCDLNNPSAFEEISAYFNPYGKMASKILFMHRI